MVNLSSTNETTLYNVCSLPLGDIMSTVGNILSTVGDILSTVGDQVQYRGRIS